jgi:hypothetical protein
MFRLLPSEHGPRRRGEVRSLVPPDAARPVLLISRGDRLFRRRDPNVALPMNATDRNAPNQHDRES